MDDDMDSYITEITTWTSTDTSNKPDDSEGGGLEFWQEMFIGISCISIIIIILLIVYFKRKRMKNNGHQVHVTCHCCNDCVILQGRTHDHQRKDSRKTENKDTALHENRTKTTRDHQRKVSRKTENKDTDLHENRTMTINSDPGDSRRTRLRNNFVNFVAKFKRRETSSREEPMTYGDEGDNEFNGIRGMFKL